MFSLSHWTKELLNMSTNLNKHLLYKSIIMTTLGLIKPGRRCPWFYFTENLEAIENNSMKGITVVDL